MSEYSLTNGGGVLAQFCPVPTSPAQTGDGSSNPPEFGAQRGHIVVPVTAWTLRDPSPFPARFWRIEEPSPIPAGFWRIEEPSPIRSVGASSAELSLRTDGNSSRG